MLTYSQRRLRHPRRTGKVSRGGSYHYFLEDVRAEIDRAQRQGRAGLASLAPRLFGWIADPRNLRLAYDHLAAKGGPAPGPNGISYELLDNSSVWSLVRLQAERISQGRYRPGAVRTVRSPKSSGDGFRTISLENIEDRLVGRAAAQIVEPVLTPDFDPHSFCRSGRGCLEALATADAYYRRQRRTVWIVNDITAAFDSVPLARLRQVVDQRVPCPQTAALLAEVVGKDRRKGLRQGSPLSQLLMNLYLDHFLDRPWRRRHPQVPLLRYMDDMLVPCRAGDEVEAVRRDLRKVVADAGLQLKFDDPVAQRNLGLGETADWLGFEIAAGVDGIRPMLKLGDGLGDLPARLREHLLEQHNHPQSPLGAVQVIHGTVAQMGPAYLHSDRKTVYALFRHTAAELAFEEIPSFAEFDELWRQSYARWADCKKAALYELEEES